jgi:hypothetical protein
MQNQQQQPPTHFFNNHVSPYNNNNNNNNSSNDECNTSSSSSASFGGDQKYVPWNKQQQPKSPNNLMPKSPTTSQQFNKQPPANASQINRFDVSPNHDYNNKNRNQNVNQMNMVPPSNYAYNPKNSGNNDDIDGMPNMWNYQQFNQPQPSPQIMKSTAAPYQFTPTNSQTMMSAGSSGINKDKFIRSDSILTANTDDSYDNLPTNGKYGAIGIKNSDINVFKANQWSSLQQTVLTNMDNNNYDIGSASSGSGNDSFKSIDLARSIDTTTKSNNDAHLNIGSSVSQHSQHSLNEHFLNMTISDINVSRLILLNFRISRQLGN